MAKGEGGIAENGEEQRGGSRGGYGNTRDGNGREKGSA